MSYVYDVEGFVVPVLVLDSHNQTMYSYCLEDCIF